MEIYNEEINDLLAPEHRKLQIHENLEVCQKMYLTSYYVAFVSFFYLKNHLEHVNEQRGIYVAGLREEIVATPEQVLEFMEFGECKCSHNLLSFVLSLFTKQLYF